MGVCRVCLKEKLKWWLLIQIIKAGLFSGVYTTPGNFADFMCSFFFNNDNNNFLVVFGFARNFIREINGAVLLVPGGNKNYLVFSTVWPFSFDVDMPFSQSARNPRKVLMYKIRWNWNINPEGDYCNHQYDQFLRTRNRDYINSRSNGNWHTMMEHGDAWWGAECL